MSEHERVIDLIQQHVDQEFDFEVVKVESITEVGSNEPDFSSDESRFRAKILLSHSQERIDSMVSSADPSEAEDVALFLNEPTQLLLIVGQISVVRSEFLNLHLS